MLQDRGDSHPDHATLGVPAAGTSLAAEYMLSVGGGGNAACAGCQLPAKALAGLPLLSARGARSRERLA